MPDLEAYIAMLAVFASAHTYMPGCCLLLEAYIAMLAAMFVCFLEKMFVCFLEKIFNPKKGLL